MSGEPPASAPANEPSPKIPLDRHCLPAESFCLELSGGGSMNTGALFGSRLVLLHGVGRASGPMQPFVSTGGVTSDWPSILQERPVGIRQPGIGPDDANSPARGVARFRPPEAARG
jgi:hypothetical protein